jgi:D-alanyl-D-alanine carboxypeptidase
MKSSFYEVIILRAIIVIFLVKIFTLGLTFSAFAAPSIEGESFILIDGKTGQVLYGKDINRKLHLNCNIKCNTPSERTS